MNFMSNAWSAFSWICFAPANRKSLLSMRVIQGAAGWTSIPGAATSPPDNAPPICATPDNELQEPPPLHPAPLPGPSLSLRTGRGCAPHTNFTFYLFCAIVTLPLAATAHPRPPYFVFFCCFWLL